MVWWTDARKPLWSEQKASIDIPFCIVKFPVYCRANKSLLCYLVPGVGAAVQSVQSAAEQGLSVAMMKMQVCVLLYVYVCELGVQSRKEFYIALNSKSYELISFCLVRVLFIFFLFRKCLANSQPLPQSQTMTFLRMTVSSQPQSLGTKVWTIWQITKEAVMREPPSTAQHQGAMLMANSRCLRDTKILANSLADRPDLTIRTPGMKSLLLNYKLQLSLFFGGWKVISFAFFASDVSWEIIISTTRI